jgi:hypothetical protein
MTYHNVKSIFGGCDSRFDRLSVGEKAGRNVGGENGMAEAMVKRRLG